jgi:hypothetical protein
MKAIVVPFLNGKMDLSNPGKIISIQITENGTNRRLIISRSSTLLECHSGNLNIINPPKYIDIPSNWKNKKGLNIKTLSQKDIKRLIVADYEPFRYSNNLLHADLLKLQSWANDTFDTWGFNESSEPCVLLFEASDATIRNEIALSELLTSEEISMGAVTAIMSNIDEIPVSEYNLLLFETRAMIDAEKYKKLQSFIETDNEKMALTIIDSCNMGMSFFHYLFL